MLSLYSVKGGEKLVMHGEMEGIRQKLLKDLSHESR
jgi:hypothetical protein